MQRALLPLALVVLVLAGGCTPSAAARAPGLSNEALARLVPAVFQVVVPQVNDGAIKYAEPLPVDLLPFAQRDDKLVAIGNAFAISPTRFVTTAHMFRASEAGPHDHYLLRDFHGETYEVARILRYSEYRDLVELELAQPPANLLPLEMAPQPQVGEVVYEVASGGLQGFVTARAPLLPTAPEPIDGGWRYLRLEAPAAGGFEGGPLLDGAGRVLGVVREVTAVEKRAAAIPLRELEKVSTTQSELVHFGLGVHDGPQETHADRRTATPLPATLGQLREDARRELARVMTKILADFDAQNAAQGFPGDPHLAQVLRAQPHADGLSSFVRDGNGVWSLVSQKYRTKLLPGGSEARVSVDATRAFGEVLLDRPQDVPAATFFKQPTAVADFLARDLGWGVVFAGRAIAIDSLGPPAEETHWSDVYGRPWGTYVWRIARSSESVVLHCLTQPAGWACHWNKVPMAREINLLLSAGRFAPRSMLDYSGSIADWEQYLALPRSLRPRVLDRTTVRLAGGRGPLALRAGPLAGTVDLADVSKASRLEVFVAVDPVAPTAQRIYRARLIPVKGERQLVGASEMLEPIASSSAHEVATWKKVGAQEAPYDGNAHVDGKWNLATGLLQGGGVAPPGKRLLYFCRAPVAEPKGALEATCAQFRASLKAPPPVEEP